MSNISYSDMSKEAQLVAKTLMEAAKAFNKELLSFMVTQMEEYGKDTSLSAERRWELTQAIIHIIYSCVAKQRMGASEFTIAESHQVSRGSQLIWSSLQVYKVQRAFLDAGFKNHSSIAPLLTQYLLDIVAFGDELEGIREEVAIARKEANEAKRKVDKLEGKSSAPSPKATKRGGGAGRGIGGAGRGNANNAAATSSEE